MPDSGPPERERFLAEPHIGALSVVERPACAPRKVPIWYHYTPGGELWVHTASDSRKARSIRATGRFSLMVCHAEVNIARYIFLDPGAQHFFVDWDAAATLTTALLRAEAGREPHDRALRELIGELSTLSTEFRTQ